MKTKEFISPQEIEGIVTRLAVEINDMPKKWKDKVILLVVLDGAFIFAADLMRKLNFTPDVKFIKYKSYKGTKSNGSPESLLPLEGLEDKNIIIIEDIVDTGNTIDKIIQDIRFLNYREWYICTLLFKPTKYKKPWEIEFKGVSIPDIFVVGYGMDYNGELRNLKGLVELIEE